MPNMSLAVLRRQVCAKAAIDNSASGDQPLVDQWINEAVEDILLKSHCSVRPAGLDLTEGQDSYSLPSQVLAILDVFNLTTGGEYRMQQLTIPEISAKRHSASSPPARYYAIKGDLLEVFPTPGTGEKLELWYVPRPALLAAVGDVAATIPAEYHKLIEWYAMAEACEYTRHKPSQFGSYYKSLYEKGLMEMRRGINRRSSVPAKASVGYPDSVVGWPAHDNSQDTGW